MIRHIPFTDVSWKRFVPLLLLAPALLLIGTLFLGPLLQSVATSLQDDITGQGTLENYRYFLHSAGYLTDLWFTVAIGLLTVLLCSLIALPLALLLRQDFRGKNLLWVLVLLPLVTPHIIAAYALRLTLSPASPLLFWLPQGGGGMTLVNAWPGLLIALTWKFFPVLLLPLTAAFQGLPGSYEEVARDLGAGTFRRLSTILLPLIAPGWIAGATLVFILAISQFTMTLVIYGGQKVTTIPIDIYFETFSLQHPGLAAALGLVLTLITLLLVVCATWWVRHRTQRWLATGPGLLGLSAQAQAMNSAGPRTKSIALMLFIAGTTLFMLGPILCLLLYSVSDQWIGGTPLPARYTLRWYAYFFHYEKGFSALGQSVAIALATMGTTMLVALPTAYALARFRFWGREILEGLFLAKNTIPIIVIAVGTATLFYSWQLTDTLLGIVLAHSAGALPLSVRSVTAALERVDRSQEEAARDLGAGALRCFWWVTLPVALGGLMGGAVLSFLYSMDEFTVTFLISGVNYTTLPLVLYSSLSQGYIEPTAAGSVVLLVPSLLYLALLVRVVGSEWLVGGVNAG